ncbi:MAG: hypothetical protein QW650_01060 [Thermofilum sp.]
MAVFAAGQAFAAFGVSVTNFGQLVNQLVDKGFKMVANKMEEIFKRELDIKKLPGLLKDPKGVTLRAFRDFVPWSDEFVRLVGSKGLLGIVEDRRAFEEGMRLFREVVSKGAVVPSPTIASSSPERYMEEVRKVSVLLAGPPVEMRQDLNPAAKRKVALDNAGRQALVSSYERSAQAVVVARRLREELKNFSPEAIDSATPEQAVKDLAKLMYYSVMLECEQLEVMALAEMRGAIGDVR